MTIREVEHTVTVQAPAAEIYRLIADVTGWPVIFPPSVHVDRVEESGSEERIRIWATANGAAKNWTSHRILDSEALRITFRQEVPAPPVAAMGGTWILEPVDEQTTRVRLLHDYRAVEDDPESLRWIDEAVDRNSRSELESLKRNVERATHEAELTFSFEDSVRIEGATKDVYDFLNEADRWTERLPHVSRVELTEDAPGLQVLEMDTLAKDGSAHTTKSIRVCFPHERIVYKQITLPALLLLHTGYWHLVEDGDGLLATSQHTVTLNTANIARILGEDAGVAEARTFIQGALSTNSRATLGHAKAYAEARRG
ncbi:aromatase/cyclase [Streptomyces sp. NPDC003032]